MKSLILSDCPIDIIPPGRSEKGSVIVYSGNCHEFNVCSESAIDEIYECHILLANSVDKTWLISICQQLKERNIKIFIVSSRRNLANLRSLFTDSSIVPAEYNCQMSSYGYNLICVINDEHSGSPPQPLRQD